MDTRCVRRTSRFTICAVMAVSALVCAAQNSGNHSPVTWQSAVRDAAKSAPEARIVVLDVATGRLLASSHLAEAARTLAAPGSTLKPLVLYGLVSAGRWDPARRVACSRKLRIAGHSMNCSHPPANPMDAQAALAWSCNTYFSAVAGVLTPSQLRQLLMRTGLLAVTGLAGQEAAATFREPHTPDEIRLTVLGVEGVQVTPLELATSYRWLALQFASHPDSAAASVVEAGLADSASFGMAGTAALGGVPVAGKTGTASAETGGQSHGWFVGLAPAGAPGTVVAVYLPAGHGSDAANVAAQLLAHSPLRRP